MTENLLQKLEEKVMSMVMELESVRGELNQLRRENAAFKLEKADSTKKLQGLISLLDATDDAHQSLFVAELDVLQAKREVVTS